MSENSQNTQKEKYEEIRPSNAYAPPGGQKLSVAKVWDEVIERDNADYLA